MHLNVTDQPSGNGECAVIGSFAWRLAGCTVLLRSLLFDQDRGARRESTVLDIGTVEAVN